MKKHLHNFMIGQFKRTFQILYLDEICCFLYVYVYMLLFIQETYIVLIIHKTILIRFLHLFSQIPIYRRGLETNQERIYKLNQHLHLKVNLNSFLFPVLEYWCPPPTLQKISMLPIQKQLFKCSQAGLRKLGGSHLYSRTGNK